MIAQLCITYPHSHDTRAHAHHFEAYFSQCPPHHTVHFIAPAATSLADDLVVVRFRIQDDGTTQQYVEIFEWDRVLMSSMYGSERREIWPHVAVKAYAMQIGRKFQSRLSGRWPVQGSSGAYERLEGILIHFITLMDVDSAPGVAFKAGIE